MPVPLECTELQRDAIRTIFAWPQTSHIDSSVRTAVQTALDVRCSTGKGAANPKDAPTNAPSAAGDAGWREKLTLHNSQPVTLNTFALLTLRDGVIRPAVVSALIQATLQQRRAHLINSREYTLSHRMVRESSTVFRA
uniref:Uncharacterized protein n=1 Tax=Lygus hesperus TaxID=30085 RepID=A0A146L064_LYGHE